MIDKSSPEWPGMKSWLQLAIETKRLALESGHCGLAEADRYRGAIMFAREIIAYVEPPATLPPSEPVSPPGTSY